MALVRGRVPVSFKTERWLPENFLSGQSESKDRKQSNYKRNRHAIFTQ
jgi:hypothetical protein